MLKRIEELALAFSLKLVALHKLPIMRKDYAHRVMMNQVLRSGTSVGACVQEARSAESKADFVHKLSISEKEARESLYWLRMLEESVPARRDDISVLRSEANQLVAMISSVVIGTKRNM